MASIIGHDQPRRRSAPPNPPRDRAQPRRV